MKRRDHVCGVMESCFAPSHSLRRLDDDGASCLFAELDARNFPIIRNVRTRAPKARQTHSLGREPQEPREPKLMEP